MKVNKLEKFSVMGLKAFAGSSCAYGAYICAKITERSGQFDPIITVVGIGLGAASGVLLESTIKDIYSGVANKEDQQ